MRKGDFLFVWHFSYEIWHNVMSHDPALLAKTEMFLLYPSMTPWHITTSPAYRELFQNSLTWIFYNLFTFILPLFQLFRNLLQPSKSKCVHIYKIHLRWSVKTLEIFSLYFCQLHKSLREWTNHRFLVLLHFYKTSQLLWNLDCMLESADPIISLYIHKMFDHTNIFFCIP